MGYSLLEEGAGAAGDEARTDDAIDTVVARMRTAGVEGLPQNYAIFYHAYVGTDQKLCSALQALGHKPAQEKLDELLRNHGHDATYLKRVEDAHGRIMEKLGEIAALASREQLSLEKYANLLTSTTAGITAKGLGQELLGKLLSILSNATAVTLQQSRRSAHSITEHSEELQAIRRELESYKNLADTDHLTELWNRRAFTRVVAGIFEEKKQHLFSALILLDIDRFKDLNDQHGHLIGDKVLQRVAQIMKAKSGSHVSLFRVGGEEFALIVEGLREESTVQFANDIRLAIQKQSFDDLASGVRITISAGICKATDATNPEDLFAKADSALYASKARGRNQVTAYPVPSTPQRKDWMLYRGE